MDNNSANPPPFSLYNRDAFNFPVLLSVPHAGRVYRPEIMNNLQIPARHLLRLEDRYADRLVTSAIETGFAAIVAHEPRAWIDLNRNKTEIDVAWVEGVNAQDVPQPSVKVRGGLGLVPTRLGGIGNLWRQKWQWHDIQDRIDKVHTPYHDGITAILCEMRDRFGAAILLDIHSMPPSPPQMGVGPLDLVIGDRFGRSSNSRYSDMVMGFFEREGMNVRLNNPYAGGFVLDRHGDPERAVHAIQIEVDRRCYLDTQLLEPGRRLPQITELIKGIAQMLATEIAGPRLLAAE